MKQQKTKRLSKEAENLHLYTETLTRREVEQRGQPLL